MKINNKLIYTLIAVVFIFPFYIALASEQVGALNSEEQELYDEIHNSLPFTSRVIEIFDNLKPATLAGRQRKCNDFPDEVHRIPSGQNKLMTCNADNALINAYWVDSNGGWQYFVERAFPPAWNWQANSERAYECYYCPAIADECSAGESICVTDKTYRNCVDGEFGLTQRCGSSEICDSGSCKGGEGSCNEQWTCGQWSECSITGQQRRTCTDTNSCGTTTDIPPTEQTCTPSISGVGNFGKNLLFTSSIIAGLVAVIFILRKLGVIKI